MKHTCVFVLFLAVTSSSLGTPIEFNTQLKWGSRKVDSSLNRVKVEAVDVIEDFHQPQNYNGPPPPPPPPKAFDWRSKDGVITPVKNQGDLGDPVAIAAVECVESLMVILNKKEESLSMAEVTDCCNTHLLGNVFECIHDLGGLCSASTYPVKTGHCRNTSCTAVEQIQGGKQVPKKNVMDMIEALLINPLLVYVDAGETSFEMYEGGIYSNPNCNSEKVDHALQVVGYGEEEGKQFWICKNSWGPSWGENGYIRIAKGVDMCGIESFASYPY